MNKEQARKLIAIVSQEKRHIRELEFDDFKNILVYKRRFLSDVNLERFVQDSLNEGLLSNVDGKILINFNAAGENIPIDFVINEETLFEEVSADRSLVDRILDIIVSSGKLTKKDAIKKSREIMPNIKDIDLAVRLIVLMNDLNIDYTEIKKEIEKNIVEIISLQ